MMNYKKGISLSLAAIALCLGRGCHRQAIESKESKQSEIRYDEEDWFSETSDVNTTRIDLNTQNGTVAIQEGGTYIVEGSLSGTLLIDVAEDETVRLVLNSISIESDNAPAILCVSAQKLIVSMPAGSVNTLSVQREGQKDDIQYPALLYAQDDLTLNGTGTLSLNAQDMDAICTKDTLKIMDGNYQVRDAQDGIIGRDDLYIHSGRFTLSTRGDGLKTTYDKDTSKGDLMIENGNFTINAKQDGIQSERNLVIYDGTFEIKSGEGSASVVHNAQPDMRGPQFMQGQGASGDVLETDADSDTISTKGIKAGNEFSIEQGSFIMDCEDDSFHANGDLNIHGGTYQVQSGDDAFHSDQTLSVADGTIEILKSYEGLEGSQVILSGGMISVIASDDGINAAGEEENSHRIEIHDGKIQVDALGDGLDANGSIVMDGGSVVIYGPQDGANGALDYDQEFTMNGGILLAVGSAQMAQAPSSNSEQYGFMIHTEMQAQDTLAYISDQAGNVLIGFCSPRAFSSVVLSMPQLKEGESYTLYAGGQGGVIQTGGYYTGAISGGEEIATITLNEQITQSGTGGMPHQGFDAKPDGGRREPLDGHFPQGESDFPPEFE